MGNSNSRSNSEDFFQACKDGKIGIVRQFVKEGFDVNELGGGVFEAPGLYYAARQGHTEVCRFLVKNAQANIDIPSKGGHTPLFGACGNGKTDCAKLLIKAGADLNVRDDEGNSAVYISSYFGEGDCLKILIESGADINLPSNIRTTPVSIDVQEKNTECLQALIEAKAHLNAQDQNGETALTHAVRSHKEDSVNFLIEGGADINLADFGGFSPLCYASKEGAREIATRLIEARADPAISGWNGNNSLHLAAWGGKQALFSNSVWFDCFCGSEVQINEPNHYGFTPLHLAALGKHTSTVQFLLDHGADINLRTNLGDTPLHCAVMGGDNGCIEAITKASKLDGSLKNMYGMTAADVYHQQYPDQPLPELMQEKVMQNDLSQLALKIRAEKFVEVAKIKNSSISLENVKLISREHFLSANEIPHYKCCEQKGWHLTANDLVASNRVLFVSHRWGSLEKPDPDRAQYNIVVNFLNSSQGKAIGFLWVDYSCICQEKNTALFKVHLDNIPTAVWTATDFLIIPKVVLANEEFPGDSETTDLKDYLSRGWCVLEAMAGMSTGTLCHLAFQFWFNTIRYEQFDRPEGAASDLVFYHSKMKVWNNEQDTKFPGVWQLWDIVEPCTILGLLIKVVKSKSVPIQDILQRALNLSLELEDILSAPEEITKIWNLLGECEVQADKVPVMNLMLFIG